MPHEQIEDSYCAENIDAGNFSVRRQAVNIEDIKAQHKRNCVGSTGIGFDKAADGMVDRLTTAATCVFCGTTSGHHSAECVDTQGGKLIIQSLTAALAASKEDVERRERTISFTQKLIHESVTRAESAESDNAKLKSELASRNQRVADLENLLSRESVRAEAAEQKLAEAERKLVELKQEREMERLGFETVDEMRVEALEERDALETQLTAQTALAERYRGTSKRYLNKLITTRGELELVRQDLSGVRLTCSQHQDRAIFAELLSQRNQRKASAARHEGRMEALNAVFQINGPSRAIARLKERYIAEIAALAHDPTGKEGEAGQGERTR